MAAALTIHAIFWPWLFLRRALPESYPLPSPMTWIGFALDEQYGIQGG